VRRVVGGDGGRVHLGAPRRHRRRGAHGRHRVGAARHRAPHQDGRHRELAATSGGHAARYPLLQPVRAVRLRRRRPARVERLSGIPSPVATALKRTIVAFVLAILSAGTAYAQSAAKLPVIGILATGQLRTAPPYPALERALGELGLVDGQSVRIEFRMAEGHIERLPDLAVELVRANVDVIVAGGTLPSLDAARRATRAIPMVMIAVDYDPLETKVVSSLSRPGGNITGVFIRQVELTAKRMELLKEIAPKAKRIAIFTDPFTVDQFKMAESTAPTFGLRLQPVKFKTLPYDYAAAFASVAKERSGAALVMVGPNFFRDRAQLIEIATRQRIPM